MWVSRVKTRQNWKTRSYHIFFSFTRPPLLGRPSSKALMPLHVQIQKIDVVTINQPRPGKKLLVLDLDYTLLDFKGTAESMNELKRPYCDEFLTVVSASFLPKIQTSLCPLQSCDWGGISAQCATLLGAPTSRDIPSFDAFVCAVLGAL